MSILMRSQVRTHTGSYQTIGPNAPIGLLCLRELFEQEDSAIPNSQRLGTILARDFRDLENGSERSKAREDVIGIIMSRRSRYSKYQTDISQCWSITNADKSQTVLFEGIRFIMFLHDTEWIRVPLSGRIEVRPVTRDGKPAGEIVQRKLTMDLTNFWKRREVLNQTPTSPHSTKSNLPPTWPPVPELYGEPFLDTTPKAEAYGDAAFSEPRRKSFLGMLRGKNQEAPQIVAPDQQFFPVQQGQIPQPQVSRTHTDSPYLSQQQHFAVPVRPKAMDRFDPQSAQTPSYQPYQAEPRHHESEVL